jgi:hypothetical protein
LRPRKPRIYPDTFRSIVDLDYEGELQIVFGKHDHDMRVEPYADLASKLNRARLMAIRQGSDLFIVEADMIVPGVALTRMSTVDADIVYGLYVSRRGHHEWLVCTELDEQGATHLSGTSAAEVYGRVIRTVGVGTGCTLIKNHVLPQIEFRYGRFAPDWYLSIDAQKLGLKQAHDLGVQCGHISGDTVYWPTPDGEHRKALYQAQSELTSYKEHRSIWPGEEFELDDTSASILLRMGRVKAAQGGI